MRVLWIFLAVTFPLSSMEGLTTLEGTHRHDPEGDGSSAKRKEDIDRALLEAGRSQNAELRERFAAALRSAGENGALPVWMAAIEQGLLSAGTITLEDVKTITPPGTLSVQEGEDGKAVARVSFGSASLAGGLPPLVKVVPREDVADDGRKPEWFLVMTFAGPVKELEKWEMIRGYRTAE